MRLDFSDRGTEIGGENMKRLTRQQRLCIVCAALVLLIAAILILCSILQQDRSLEDEIASYASANGLTVAEVKKDASLMQEIEMEAQRDKSMESRMEEIEVTAEELGAYKTMIGNTMDVKKAILIFFPSQEECAAFIEQYGASANPESQGIGIIPQMEYDENGEFFYYNIGGKQTLETVFDSLKDGAYSVEPLAYAGMYCYLKRLSVDAPTDDEITQMIKQKKQMEVEH